MGIYMGDGMTKLKYFFFFFQFNKIHVTLGAYEHVDSAIHTIPAINYSLHDAINIIKF